MTSLKNLKERLLQNPEVKTAYDGMAEEFAVSEMLVKARTDAGLSQAEVAQRMDTTQPSIARMESGTRDVSLKSLRAYAQATGRRLRISLEPVEQHPQQ